MQNNNNKDSSYFGLGDIAKKKKKKLIHDKIFHTSQYQYSSNLYLFQV